MHDSQAFSWLPYFPAESQHDIKVEATTDISLLSPPTSPYLHPSGTTSASASSLCRRRSASSASSPKRVRPYPLPRTSRSHPEDTMATSPASHATWGRTGNGSRQTERRSSDGDQPLSYSSPGFTTVPFGRPSDTRPASSSSSLTGAMGPSDAHLSSHPHARLSGSPPPRGDIYNMSISNQSMGWTAGQLQPMTVASHPSLYAGVAGNMPYVASSPDLPGSFEYRNRSESLSPPSPFITTSYNDQYGTLMNSATNSSSPYQSTSSANTLDELRHLRRKVLQLELMHEQESDRVRALEAELSKTRGLPHSASGLPSPLQTPPQSSSFEASWKARTDARIRQFCSLNRAGNALCSWHDSRRERRVHPPRMAPAGYLNCGCTFDEALFEESLARHGVGSYLPGETVRMDPALRNPLLKLLQERFGYRDGDFERDPLTGNWVAGEGPALWEQQIQAGITNPHRTRPDHERR